MAKILPASFFEQPTLQVAEKLIGKCLVMPWSGGQLVGRISETEAYTQEDPACHTYNGCRTSRNEPMYGPGGTLYIYFIYGMYHCLNIVTEPVGRGCAVLIRGMVPLEGEDEMRRRRNWSDKPIKGMLDGPGKLMQALQVPLDWTGRLIDEPEVQLQILDIGYDPKCVDVLPRVGISKGADLLWRFREPS